MTTETIVIAEVSDSERFCRVLASEPFNGIASNKALRLALQWQDEVKYWEIRNILLDAGKLELGRGQGGSVRLIEEKSTEPTKELENQSQVLGLAKPLRKETDFYKDFRTVIDRVWVKDKRFSNYVIEITAQQGSRGTGKWSRPDLTVVGMTILPYIPSKVFDVVSFELKLIDGLDITAVYEALAHKKAATMSYVVVVLPDKADNGEVNDRISEVEQEAKIHGIGLMTFSQDKDNEWTYETWTEATRQEASPALANELIAQQFPQEKRDRIALWFR